MSSLVKSVFIFRHGETDWNRERRMQGQTDRPLNATGFEQARSLIPILQKQNIQAIYTSDLQRARSTADVVAQALGLPLFSNPDLRETNLGEAEGLTADEIMHKWSEETWKRWASIHEADWTFAFPGGESKSEHRLRLQSAIETILRASPYERIAISTHGGAMRRLLHHWQPQLNETVMIGNCAVYATQAHIEKESSVVRWTVLGHLNPPQT